MCVCDIVMIVVQRTIAKYLKGEHFNVDPLSNRQFGPLSSWDMTEPLT